MKYLRREYTVHGDLVDDNSEEPRFDVSGAASLLANCVTAEQSHTVLAMVRPQDRRRVIELASAKQLAAQEAAARATWSDQVLPFAEDAWERHE